jgi:hypothetical protein
MAWVSTARHGRQQIAAGGEDVVGSVPRCDAARHVDDGVLASFSSRTIAAEGILGFSLRDLDGGGAGRNNKGCAALGFLKDKARFQQGGWNAADGGDLRLACTGYVAGIKRS